MRRPSALILLATLSTTPLAGADWPQWRGPLGTGVAPDTDPVATFNPTTGENVRWTTPLPGPSSGTPAVVGDKVFVPVYNRSTGMLQSCAIDRATGELLWAKDVARGRDSRERNRENYLAECSPIADDERAYFFYGTGDLVCYDHAGEKLWGINVQDRYGDLSIQWGFASSPLLLDGKLYVTNIRRQGESYLACIDPASGEVLWKTERRNDANAESREAYTTPLAVTLDGKTQIVLYGGDALTGHDPATGQELWRYTEELNPRGARNYRVISGPTQGPDGKIYVATPRGDVLLAIEVTDNQPEVAWMYEDADSDVPCPACIDGAVFVLNGGRGQLTKLNAQTGEVIWTGRLDARGDIRSSPLVAGGRVYMMDYFGNVYVASAGDAFEVIARIDADGDADEDHGYPARASIAVAGDDLFIRIADRLVCAGRE